jgi:hypothetical protein
MLVATGTWYHVMSFDITRCHDRTDPELSQLATQGVLAPRDLLYSLPQHPFRNTMTLQSVR